jgi:hypothetical protein
MGVLLRKNRSAHENEGKLRSDLEDLCAIVDASKAWAAQDLVAKIYKGLTKDLQRLFLDIALFIIPSVGNDIVVVNEVIVSILSKLQGTSEQMLKMKVRPIKSDRFIEADSISIVVIQVRYACMLADPVLN